MTREEYIRNAESEIVRLQEHSTFLKDWANTIESWLEKNANADPPLVQGIAVYNIKSARFQALTIDQQVEVAKMQVRLQASSVIIPTVGGMQ